MRFFDVYGMSRDLYHPIKLYATLIYSWLKNKYVTFWKAGTDLPMVLAIV